MRARARNADAGRRRAGGDEGAGLGHGEVVHLHQLLQLDLRQLDRVLGKQTLKGRLPRIQVQGVPKLTQR